jgi:hypothetical protein
MDYVLIQRGTSYHEELLNLCGGNKAVYAMHGSGTFRVRTWRDNNCVLVEVGDTRRELRSMSRLKAGRYALPGVATISEARMGEG